MLNPFEVLFRPKATDMSQKADDVSRVLDQVHPACVKEIHATFEGTIRALGQALELRDFETRGHTDRVVRWTEQMSEPLKLPEADKRAIKWGAYLHDIGKSRGYF